MKLKSNIKYDSIQIMKLNMKLKLDYDNLISNILEYIIIIFKISSIIKY